MAENNVQYKIGEKEMEELRKNSKNAKKEEKKEKMSTGTVIFRVFCWVVAIAYFALLLFGKRFLPEEGMFLSSLDLFSGAENPNHLIRIASLCILTLTISTVLQFLIGKMADNKNVTKKQGGQSLSF